MKKINIIVCEDMKSQRTLYTKLCRRISEKHGIDVGVREYESGSDLMFDLEDPKFYNTLDILFLDISMPGISGIETAQQARQTGYAGVIVFITSSVEHYKDAFDVGALNYITKGENIKRFEEIFLKAVDSAKAKQHELITLSGWSALENVEIRSIEYFKVSKGIITVYYNDKEFEFNGCFDSLEKQLSDSGFYRLHRNYLVSLVHVKTTSFTEVVMSSGAALPVGRKRYHDFKAALDKIKAI